MRPWKKKGLRSQEKENSKMGIKNVYERFVWFDNQVRGQKYPNATSLADQFEISTKTAQRDIDFMRDRLRCPLDYDSSQKVKLLKDGSLEISFPVSDFSEIKREILKHGGEVEVIKPKDLRDLIKAEAEKIAKIY
jgi:predicted DNA-binding transcriptional regulator YafY